YNERGWLKSSTSNEFSMELKYEDATHPQFNGNISVQSWGSGLSLPNAFNYEYDKLNRLSKAASTGIIMSEELNYDEMGNITGLNRDNSGIKLYNYEGNKLLSVNSLTGQYNYDINGNVVKDGRNGMDLTYNSLNLPVTATDGTRYLNYVYDATGKKLARYTNGNLRSYFDGIEGDEDHIDIIHTEEGVARNNSGSYSYEYNLSDHLGNVRATFYQNPANQQIEVIQRDDYYAFGLRKMNSPNSNTNKYLYNGKELQEELG
ncbi:RHS repeat domain-containing protein, partial [Pedobacter sp. Leaf176]|uniref:RHS repeat domain-containing protein n=1 Tax=Pedobacter sp. Leaf176 TaxID=1736286 RepID=UPI0035115952